MPYAVVERDSTKTTVRIFDDKDEAVRLYKDVAGAWYAVAVQDLTVCSSEAPELIELCKCALSDSARVLPTMPPIQVLEQARSVWQSYMK